MVDKRGSLILSEAIIYEKYKNKFCNEAEAKRYSFRHLDSKKNEREKACISHALASIEKGSCLLDLPCGTGRLTYFMHNLGFRVVGADCSQFMINCALKNKTNESIQFVKQDVLAIQYPNNTFAATVCNRLFHHYPNAELRRKALAELARVTDGPIIVSFFNSLSLSAIWKKIRNKLKGIKPVDRISFSIFTFKKDVAAVGLEVEKIYFTRFGLSPQTYFKLKKIK